MPLTLQNAFFGFNNVGLGNPYVFTILGFGCPAGRQCKAGTTPPPATAGADVLTAGLTTTGAGAVLTSRYLIPQDPLNPLGNDYGPSDFDVRHRLVIDYSWDVPFWRGAKGAVNWFGNWKLSGIILAQSGQPFTVFSGPIGGEMTQRANASGAVRTTGDPNAYISGTFTLPGNTIGCRAGFVSGIAADEVYAGIQGAACTGNTSRNQFTGPNFAKMDFAVQKGIQFGERRALALRAEFFNIFNRDNFYNPISAISVDGTNRNPYFGRIKSAHPARQIQLAARFSW